MTFYVSLLTHLAKSVKLSGPLGAHSASVSGSTSSDLLKLIQSSTILYHSRAIETGDNVKITQCFEKHHVPIQTVVHS